MIRDQRANEGGEVVFCHYLLNISSEIVLVCSVVRIGGTGIRLRSRGWITSPALRYSLCLDIDCLVRGRMISLPRWSGMDVRAQDFEVAQHSPCSTVPVALP